MAALSSTHARRDAIVLQASRGFASAPNSPRVFLQSKRWDLIHQRLIQSVAEKPNDSSIEGMANRLCSMFPTAREYDVRELLEKYHYREAVVVSALQVMKYPMTMPGPATVGTPQMRGRFDGRYPPPQPAWSESDYQTTAPSDGRQSKLGALSSHSATPSHSPAARRPPHSPKIKLRYLKSVFPKAEETYLLDLLSCSDNNVNDVTQQLLSLGHLKKDYPQPLTPRRNLTTPPVKNTVAPPTIVTEPIPRKIPSQTEIEKVKGELQKLFPDEEEVVISLAIESADYDLEKARVILSTSQECNENFTAPKTHLTVSGMKKTMTLASLRSSPSMMSTLRDIAALYSPMKGDVTFQDATCRIKPRPKKIIKDGPLHCGANDALLGESYVATHGHCPDLVKGPDSSLRSKLITKPVERVKAQGALAQNRQGPASLARGSLSTLLSRKTLTDPMRRI